MGGVRHVNRQPPADSKADQAVGGTKNEVFPVSPGWEFRHRKIFALTRSRGNVMGKDAGGKTPPRRLFYHTRQQGTHR